MINPYADVNWKPASADMRKFGRSLLIGAVVLTAVFSGLSVILPRIGAHLAGCLIAFAAIFSVGLGATFLPRAFRPFYFIWYGVSCTIGFAVSNCILFAFYILLFTPIGFLRRSFGPDSLQLKARDAETLFHDHPGPPEPRRYFKQF